MTKRKPTPKTNAKIAATSPPAPPTPRPKRPPKLEKRADAFKKFHIAVAIAPAFIEEYFLQGRAGRSLPDDYETLADAINELANAIAHRLDWS